MSRLNQRNRMQILKEQTEQMHRNFDVLLGELENTMNDSDKGRVISALLGRKPELNDANIEFADALKKFINSE